MNKLKVFFLGAGLLLATAGVFAGAKKFFLSGQLYVSNGTTTVAISPSGTIPGGLVTGTTPLTIDDAAGHPYGLYYYPSGGPLTAVTSAATW